LFSQVLSLRLSDNVSRPADISATDRACSYRKESPRHKMLRYLSKRQCPEYSFDFVVVLLDRDSLMQWINGFCGRCDHHLSWKLFRRKVSDESTNAFLDSLTEVNSIGLRTTTRR